MLFFEHKYLYRRVRGEVPAGDYFVLPQTGDIVAAARWLAAY